MAEMLYPTSTSVSGPWLLDSDSLLELDRVIDELWPRLEEAQQAMFEEQVQERVDDRMEGREENERAEIEASVRKFLAGIATYSSKRRDLSLTLKDGKILKTNSFKEAKLHPEIENSEVSRFSLSLKCGEIKCDLHTWVSDTLDIEVSPREAEVSRQLYTAVNSWAKSAAPSPLLRNWKRFAGVQWFVFVLILWVAVVFLIQGTSQWKDEARMLLDHGINSPADQAKATELLLKIASDYSVPSQRRGVPAWFKVFTYSGFLACLVLSFPPPYLLIGLGRGATRINRWRRWIKFAFASVPIFLISTFLRLFVQRLHF